MVLYPILYLKYRLNSQIIKRGCCFLHPYSALVGFETANCQPGEPINKSKKYFVTESAVLRIEGCYALLYYLLLFLVRTGSYLTTGRLSFSASRLATVNAVS